MENLKYQNFTDINLDDPFFVSLKEDYKEFSSWFIKKSENQEKAYVLYDDINNIEGFMYLKVENGYVNDISPILPKGVHLKIGTFKFDSAGTRRGERFLKKVFDHAIESGVVDIYVTVFSKHEYLMRLFSRYGFIIHGSKESANGTENVLIRNLQIDKHDILKNYPKFNIRQNSKYIFSIHPEYHTRMLPDSILDNEDHSLIEDVSHTNSIHKIYLCNMPGVMSFRAGDVLVTYRTSDGKGPAKYRSVITSICVVEEYKNINDFTTLQSFLSYSSSYSVFSVGELTGFYHKKNYPHIIKFTYNTAIKKRVIRDVLIRSVGLRESDYWGVMKLTDEQFSHMLSLGEVNERVIIN